RFIGTVVMSWALPVFAIVVAQLIDDNSDWLSGVTMLVAAGVLLTAGNSPIGASFIARTIGSVYVIAGSATLGSGLDSPAPSGPTRCRSTCSVVSSRCSRE
ncbi:MAG: hypothetical protein ACKOQ7_06650, partial [Actinomycetota bacterium]